MTDADTVRNAALTISCAFLLGFGGFTFAFGAAMDSILAYGYGLVLVLVGLAFFTKRTERTAEPTATEPTTATDGGGWKPES